MLKLQRLFQPPPRDIIYVISKFALPSMTQTLILSSAIYLAAGFFAGAGATR